MEPLNYYDEKYFARNGPMILHFDDTTAFLLLPMLCIMRARRMSWQIATSLEKKVTKKEI